MWFLYASLFLLSIISPLHGQPVEQGHGSDGTLQQSVEYLQDTPQHGVPVGQSWMPPPFVVHVSQRNIFKGDSHPCYSPCTSKCTTPREEHCINPGYGGGSGDSACPRCPIGPLEVTGITAHGCKLKWKPPNNDGCSPVDYYKIDKLDPVTGEWVSCGTSMEPEDDIAGLKEGKKYRFRVKAVNDQGESEPLQSDWIITGKPAPPGPPTSLEITDITADSCKLEWKVPTTGGPVKYYKIDKRILPSGEWVPCGSSKEPESDVVGLEEGEKYRFRVRAINDVGESEPTLSKEITAEDPGPPGAPRNLEVKDLTADSCKLNWKEPMTGGPVKYYEIEKRNLPNGEWVPCGTSKEPESDIAGLEEGEKYRFRVKAVNDAGESEPIVSKEITAEDPGPPGKPIGPIECTDITADGCKLKWKEPEEGLPIEYYKVELVVPYTESLGTPKVPELDVAGLYPKIKYKFCVTAVNSVGESQPLCTDIEISAEDPGPPGKPIGPIECTDITADGCTLKWKEPEEGLPIDHYKVEQLAPTTKSLGTPKVPELDVAGLNLGVTYKFCVTAVNNEGESDPLCIEIRLIETEIPGDDPACKNLNSRNCYTGDGIENINKNCSVLCSPESLCSACSSDETQTFCGLRHNGQNIGFYKEKIGFGDCKKKCAADGAKMLRPTDPRSLVEHLKGCGAGWRHWLGAQADGSHYKWLGTSDVIPNDSDLWVNAPSKPADRSADRCLMLKAFPVLSDPYMHILCTNGNHAGGYCLCEKDTPQ